MQIAIFGGSFNPPHIGHIEASRAAIEKLRADKMLIIPAAQAPQKEQEPDSPDAHARLSMAQLAFEGLAQTEISDIEISRGGISYTVDTLKELKKQYPDAELILMMGTDQLENFETWKDYRGILELCTLAPFPRRSGDMPRVRAGAEKLERLYGAKLHVIEYSPADICSTRLREMLPERLGVRYFRDGVYSEIIKHRFYGAQPELEWLRSKAFQHLDPKRVPHVMGCEQEAVRLARRWGGDEGLAAEAGILHDITKRLKTPEQLKLCEQYGIMTDIEERANYKLLHAKTGAALSRELFGVSDEVYSAIFWHTTGRPGMSLLEKIIYIADYIEPNRDFEGVEELRSLAYKDLDEALILGFQMSLKELERRGAKPHISSERAMEWLINKR